MSEKFDLYIIDDSTVVINKILSLLSKYDLKIKSFTNPVEAFQEIILNPPSVLFLDYMMPEMDGKNFIVKMSERYLFQYCSVYLITGSQFDEDKTQELRTLGFNNIIYKPFEEKDLVNALIEIMGDLKLKHIAA